MGWWDLDDIPRLNPTTTLDMNKAMPLSKARGPNLGQTFRWKVFTPYYRLLCLVLASNMIALVWICQKHVSNSRLIAIQTAVMANTFAVTVFRNEHIINALFRLAIFATSRAAPLWWRRFCSQIYCFDGIHSGADIAVFVWFLALTVLLVQEYTSQGPIVERSAVAVAACICTLLAAIIILTLPQIRHRMHTIFEYAHGFCAWMVIVLFWAEMVLLGKVHAQETSESLLRFLLKSVSFWLLLLTTFLAIYPWFWLRHVCVEVEKLSNQAARIWFDGEDTHTYHALRYRTIRIATNPLRETHSFAVIQGREGQNCSIVVSRAGDFTQHIIESPPKKMWIKGMPTWGFSCAATLFPRIVIVTTGSGISQCLGLVNDSGTPPCRIFWSAKAPLQTYGQGILDIVEKAEPNAVIIDTNVTGHPNMMQYTYQLYRESGAEAVLIISNAKLTHTLCQELESRGVPTFGPRGDS
jgi:hypothetical protein